MQDAHNCILNFDTDTALFAVYDGHGGHEVAAYCAEHLPEFLKTLETYKHGDIEKALEDAYLDFDHHLTKEEVVKTLHFIAGKALFYFTAVCTIIIYLQATKQKKLHQKKILMK